MAGFWALFRGDGGPSATPGWIRKGHFTGGTFGWDSPQIPTPDTLWAYTPDRHWSGFLACDPYDSDFVWVSYFAGPVETLTMRTYLYSVSSNTWTLKQNVAFGGGASDFCGDMAFDQADGHIYVYMIVSSNGALGLGGIDTAQGVYRSVDRGNFTYQGSGVDASHHYTNGNINHPQSLTALTLIPAAGETGRQLWVSHNSTWTGSGAVWVTAVSGDEGVSWSENPINHWPGNQFMSESYGVLRYTPTGGVGGDGWYAASNAPTGPIGADAEGKWYYDLSSATWGGTAGSPTHNNASLPMPFLSDPSKGVAWPVSTGFDPAYTNDGGGSWHVVARPVGHQPGFWYRAGRTKVDELVAAGVSLADPDHFSELWWSEDAGVTWNFALVESGADGVGFDFTPFVPPVAAVWPQVFTWADSRGFTGDTTFFVTGTDQIDAGIHAHNILDLIEPMTTARFLGARGAYNTSPVNEFPGTDGQYNNIEQRLSLVFQTGERNPIALTLPCPAKQLFLDDQQSLDLLNPSLAAAIAGIPGERLCNRGGQEAVEFAGGTRYSEPTRRKSNIRIKNPDETGPGE